MGEADINIQVLMQEIDACMEKGDNKQALLLIDKLLLKSSRKAGLFALQAHLLNEEKEYNKAIISCNKSIMLVPTRPEAYYERGFANDKLGKADDALNDYESAIKLNSKEIFCYIASAIRYIERDEFQKALDYLNRAVEMNEDDDYALYLRGVAHAGLNENEDAVKDLKKAIELNPKQEYVDELETLS